MSSWIDKISWGDKVSWSDNINWKRTPSKRDKIADIKEQMHAVYLQMAGRYDDEFVYDDERQQMLEQLMRDLQAQLSELQRNAT